MKRCVSEEVKDYINTWQGWAQNELWVSVHGMEG